MKRRISQILRGAFACLMAGAGILATAPAADAGCGCDHPPPDWAQVMPSFAAPGKTILVQAPGAGFRVGFGYDVTFDVRDSGDDPAKIDGAAVNSETVEVVVPAGLKSGPTAITVDGPKGFSQTLSSDLFATISPLPVVPAEGGALEILKLEAVVTQDGMLLIPINVRHVMDGMQLGFQIMDLALEFGPDDVVIYNADGVDLSLFTLAVDGQTEMEWGSYYGWEVEGDSGLFGAVYDTKTSRSTDPGRTSDVLTYWRHEFTTYTQAHLPGGSHEPSGGYHPDGSFHVNHGHLVLAISGLKRSANDPNDPSNLNALVPGKLNLDVHVLAIPSENPIEPSEVMEMMNTTSSWVNFDPAESHFDEFAEGGSTGGGTGGGSGGGSSGGSGGGKKK